MKQPDYIKKIFDAFPNAYINRNNEIVISDKGNVYFRLDDVNNNDDLILKILAWCSRDACKSQPYKSGIFNEKHRKFIREGCNKIIGKKFSEEDWSVIYTKLGNNINPYLASRFVFSNFDMAILTEKRR